MDILNLTRNFLLVFLLFGFVTAGQAASEQQFLRPQVASLVSSPARCVLKTGHTHCQMMVNLIWEAPEVEDYCLFHQGDSKPIKCWQQAWQGRVKIRFSASNKTIFMLKTNASSEPLSQTVISVTGNYKQRKRAQRRKRGFWRMF